MKSTYRTGQKGGALVEMALFLPLLLIILFGVVDFSRAIQFDNILIHMSREGANLAKRAYFVDDGVKANQVMSALTATSAPLDMSNNGMILITQIEGTATGEGRITSQFRANNGNSSLQSRIWACGSWNGNTCNVSAAGPLVNLPVPLNPGEKIYAVETAYKYQMLSRYLTTAIPDLYAVTIL